MPILQGRNYQLAELQTQWGLQYAALDSILGDTFTQLPFGDPHYGQPNADTFTGRRKHANGLVPTWTWKKPPSTFDTALDLTNPDSFQGIIPIIDVDGVDEEADSVDNPYWSQDDAGGANGFSISIWIRMAATGSNLALLTKANSNPDGTSEWLYYKNSSNLPTLFLTDDSANVSSNRPASTALVAGRWYHLVVTYDGAGGASAADTINHYVDGAVDNGTASNNGSYVGMEDGGMTVGLAQAQSGLFDAARFAGGPCGPIFEQAEWTAAQVKNIYELQRRALGV